MEKIMARRRNVSSEDTMDSKHTTVRVDSGVNRRFRIICLLLGKEPKNVIEELLNHWTEQNHRKISKEKFDELFVQNA